jgi:ribosomal protein L11 methyltransferase
LGFGIEVLTMQYLEIHIRVPQDFYEIIIAELSALEYDSFMESEEVLSAYIEEGVFDEGKLKEVLFRHFPEKEVTWTCQKLENKNWNEEWEKNFDPVIIGDECIVKASFHKIEKSYPFEIIINPKMSFGTGHHETTHMMLENQLTIDHKNKKVIDAGSGTGILAILAEKLGASHVLAYDIEDWSFENLKENINLNGCRNVKVSQGTVETVDFPLKEYDIVLANINKNVLLHEIPLYAKLLSSNGILMVSGFYTEDIADIENVCAKSALTRINQKEKNKWASLVFKN